MYVPQICPPLAKFLYTPISNSTGIGSEDDDSEKKYKLIHEEMSVLDSALLDEGDDLVQSRVRKVLEYLGVKPLQPGDVIKHHILPRFGQNVQQFKENKVRRERLIGKI